MQGTRYIAAYIVKDKETGLYVGIIPGMQGAHTQGDTLDELHKNLIEVVKLCLEQMPAEDKERLPEFVGIQKVEVAM